MKDKKMKLFMSLSVLIIIFLIGVLSLNIVSTQALLEENYNPYTNSFTWEWTTTEVVSTESTSESYLPSLAIDGAGNVHIAWCDETTYASSGTDYDIFYKRWDVSTSTWTTTEVVSTESTRDSYNPSLAVDAEGDVHIVWYDDTDYDGAGLDNDIFYKYWDDSTSTWNTTEVVSTESTGHSVNPSIAVDTAWDVHVAWHDGTNYAGSGTDYDIFYKYWDDSTTTWNTTEVVSTESTANSYNPSIAVDAEWDVHISWNDNTDYDGSGTDMDIFYKYWDDSTSTWTTTEVVSTDITGISENPSIAVDTSNDVFIAWQDLTDYDGAGLDMDIFYKYWDDSTSLWSTIEVVSTESTSSSFEPSIAVDAEGNIHIAWYDFTDYAGSGTDGDIFYKRWDDSTSAWSTTEVVSTESTSDSWNHSLTLDTEGNAYIAWNDHTDYAGSGTDNDIFYKQFITCPPAVPELAFIVPNPDEDGFISLDWNNVISALNYYIYRSTSYIWSVEELFPIDETTSSSYLDTITTDGYYYYAIVAENLVGNSTHSNCEYTEVKIPDLSSPELANIAPNPSQTGVINLDWNDITGATEYYIYRSTSYIWLIQGLTPITTVFSSDYIDTLLFEGSYYYAIVANDGSSNSSHSNCQYVEVKFPELEAPELAPILPNPTEITSVSLVWDSVDGAIEYYIYRSASYIWSVEGLTPIATVGSTSYVDTLPSEGIYLYVIVASDGLRNSTHSNCEYIEYKLPTLHEIVIISSLIIGLPVFLILVTKIRKKNSRTN